MPSPFPGMDPYLEGQVWPDLHHELMTEIRARLLPQILPRYVARIEERVYLEHHPEDAPRLFRPDVAVLGPSHRSRPAGGTGTAVLSEPVVVPLLMPEEVREPYLEIRGRDGQQVVTVIEVLSPANKRAGSDGYAEYLAKHDAVLLSTAHLVEIDLLRGGERIQTARPLPESDYYVIVSRFRRRPLADVWDVSLRDPLPVVPIPLANGDPDAHLDLQAALDAAYDRGAYAYSVDYNREPVPPLSPEDEAWAREILAQAGV